MARPDVLSRAREYLAKVPPAISGSGGHVHTLLTARAVVRGFQLSDSDALSLLQDWNETCKPKWSIPELQHKIASASKGPAPEKGDGYLLNGDEEYAGGPESASPPPEAPKKPEYDRERLEKFAGEWIGKIDLLWLANRSVRDPAMVTTVDFLTAIYRPGEFVYVAKTDWGLDECLWPRDPLPEQGGKEGMKFLAQPVDGEWHPNPRAQKMSRRSKESVTSWRFLVLESDKAPARSWLAGLVQLPLRIAAIYSSGGRSVHALIQLDARTEREWQEMRQRLMTGMIVLGADGGSMSSVRLTRLPGYYRAEKGQWQKLLYLNPNPPAAPLLTALSRRDVERHWIDFSASLGKRGWKEEEVHRAHLAAVYYSRVSTQLGKAAIELGEIERDMKVLKEKK